MTAPELRPTLGDVLGALSRELETLAGMSRSAQEVVSQLLTVDRGNLFADHGAKLQQLDLITQYLEELAPFVTALASSAPESCQVDVVAPTMQIRLSGLAHRLRCEPPLKTPPTAPATGDAEWF